MITFSKRGESTFTVDGFDNWKKAVEKYRIHETCGTHTEAMMKLKLAQKSPIEEQLSSQVKKKSVYKKAGTLEAIIWFEVPSSSGFSN